MAGSADLRLIVEGPLDAVRAELDAHGVTGPIRSVSVRDPDVNLVELSTRPPG